MTKSVFGMQVSVASDIVPIVKFDARAGRLFKMDYNHDTREKTPVDITYPAPKFAMDFGSLQVGYGCFTPTGPDLRVVPEGQPIPAQPTDKDDKGKLIFRPVFRVTLFGKSLDGIREWSSAANAVMEAVDDLYGKFREAPEAQGGKIPIVEMTRTIPITMGKGARQTTVYAPCFSIVGWTERVPEMGERTVPPPSHKIVSPSPATSPSASPTQATSPAQKDDEFGDSIPF